MHNWVKYEIGLNSNRQAVKRISGYPDTWLKNIRYPDICEWRILPNTNATILNMLLLHNNKVMSA